MIDRGDGHGPLVAFTSLAITGAGALAAATAGVFDARACRIAAWLGLVLLAAGLVTSLRHLGRRDRAHFAIRGLLRSPISHEGALGALTVGLGLVAASGMAAGLASPAAGPVVRGATAVLAILLLVSIGLVYRLGGQLTWGHFSAATPLTSGLAFGAILIDSLPPPHLVSTVTLVVIGIDAFVFSQRWRRIVQVSIDHADALGPAFDRRHEWLAARFLLVNALPAVSLFVWPTPLAALIAAAGIVVDRMAFYGLGLQHRTEVEIARVERWMNR
ncbi:MAG: DmsC/YnfH family molybdoenzyme membrane anchor subunit [Vicinamibacterales bacterium]|nr:DmsC/YnfH family molybdoenzyme membrane anchor subunit [Vicinamibacterales bacterium]